MRQFGRVAPRSAGALARIFCASKSERGARAPKIGGLRASNSTCPKPTYTDAVSCREAEVDNSVQFKRCDLSVMRKTFVRTGAAVSRRENETRKVQLSMLWLSCTSSGKED